MGSTGIAAPASSGGGASSGGSTGGGESVAGLIGIFYSPLELRFRHEIRLNQPLTRGFPRRLHTIGADAGPPVAASSTISAGPAISTIDREDVDETILRATPR